MNSNQKIVNKQVKAALQEDIGSGDITAELLPADKYVTAEIICRDAAIICGQAWVNEVFLQVDPGIDVTWLIKEGQGVTAGQRLCVVKGLARSLLTAERTALNFLQTLSATATITRYYVQLIADTATIILDTRKTIPGLRYAQKYAVKVGGGQNHRLGLYDAFLIKENHILACGSITAAINQARELYEDKKVEVEVETITELQEAIAAKPDIIMLDNFTLSMLAEAATLHRGGIKFEVSGGVNEKNIVAIAKTGVDYISIGALTKNINAVDLSMRILAAG